MINLKGFVPEALAAEPYRWAMIDDLFSPAARAALVSTFPRDHFKSVKGYDGEKGYEYEARSLIGMGAEVPSYPKALSPAWRQLASELLSPTYRSAISQLTGVNVTQLPMEANLFHYGPKAWLGPHVDLEDKLITHVLYFNDSWDVDDGGCLTILRSGDKSHVAQVVPPIIGNSVILVRSDHSWHAVSRVRDGCRTSRRSLAVTFYRPGALSTMWPAGDRSPLHTYQGKGFLLREWVKGRLRQLTR